MINSIDRLARESMLDLRVYHHSSMMLAGSSNLILSS